MNIRAYKNHEFEEEFQYNILDKLYLFKLYLTDFMGVFEKYTFIC